MALDDVLADPMMARLSGALDRGEDIGHYGRLVYAMVARWFCSQDELVAKLAQDKDLGETGARDLVADVVDRGYSPPKREKILEYQSEQTYPILEDAEDPHLGNVYRTLSFPDALYEHIAEYRHEKRAAAST